MNSQNPNGEVAAPIGPPEVLKAIQYLYQAERDLIEIQCRLQEHTQVLVGHLRNEAMKRTPTAGQAVTCNQTQP